MMTHSTDETAERYLDSMQRLRTSIHESIATAQAGCFVLNDSVARVCDAFRVRNVESAEQIRTTFGEAKVAAVAAKGRLAEAKQLVNTSVDATQSLIRMLHEATRELKGKP